LPTSDRRYMRLALSLARRGLGRTAPNPSVGCVLVKDNVIVGWGWTQPGGRPHAEVEALARSGQRAFGATAYVTLEPCAHVGKTGPCCDALIAAGVTRVVAALRDPDPRVSGGGFARLEAAGISVDVGLMGEEARWLNAGFLSRIERGRPWITLKLATSLDGRIATGNGASRWITGPEARARAHLLRARNDAILVGAGTALADDPLLTCRLPGMADRSPIRVVLDRRLRLPIDSALVRSAHEVPLWIVTTGEGATHEAAGAVLIRPRDSEPAAVATELAARGITRLLIEGGGAIAASFLAAGLVDELIWIRAPILIGGDGVPAVASLCLTDPNQAQPWVLRKSAFLGRDRLESWSRAE
jgi:diaminohydroxyphosphoribosylaminopyrimidine deaminase/5-amino-6-(5-phosphoribosylamino)uracil reductase